MKVLELSFVAPLPVNRELLLAPLEHAYRDERGEVLNWLPSKVMLLRDLDTGVFYTDPEVAKFLDPTSGALRPNDTVRFSSSQPAQRLRVLGCVVYSRGSEFSDGIGTRLHYEVVPDAAYR